MPLWSIPCGAWCFGVSFGRRKDLCRKLETWSTRKRCMRQQKLLMRRREGSKPTGWKTARCGGVGSFSMCLFFRIICTESDVIEWWMKNGVILQEGSKWHQGCENGSWKLRSSRIAESYECGCSSWGADEHVAWPCNVFLGRSRFCMCMFRRLLESDGWPFKQVFGADYFKLLWHYLLLFVWNSMESEFFCFFFWMKIKKLIEKRSSVYQVRWKTGHGKRVQTWWPLSPLVQSVFSRCTPTIYPLG